jgi:hypothetical protein
MRLFSPVSFIVSSSCLLAASFISPAEAENRSIAVFRAPEIVQTSAETSVTPPFEQSATAPDPSAPEPTTSLPPGVVPRLGASRAGSMQPFIEPQVNSQTRQALSFYGGQSARATLSQMPRRTPLQTSSSRPLHRQEKPFQNFNHEPTISPYLNLDRDEERGDAVPIYHTYVRPQMEQYELNRMQQRDLHQLRGQVQSMTPTVAGPQYQTNRMPGTGTQARFMDTAQFYTGRP